MLREIEPEELTLLGWRLGVFREATYLPDGGTLIANLMPNRLGKRLLGVMTHTCDLEIHPLKGESGEIHVWMAGANVYHLVEYGPLRDILLSQDGPPQ